MKVIFETGEGEKYEVTPEQIRLTQIGTRSAALQIPSGNYSYLDVMTFDCVLTLEGR
jgi:hypothetical protein